jgi:hypothetical protein
LLLLLLYLFGHWPRCKFLRRRCAPIVSQLGTQISVVGLTRDIH